MKRAVLVYQAGIANVFEVTAFNLSDYGRDAKRIMQNDFRTCEAFCRGLAYGGVIVQTAACNQAGDITRAHWSGDLDAQPFGRAALCSEEFQPVRTNPHIATIRKSDVGKHGLRRAGREIIPMGDAIGRIQAIDVGKRVYRVPTDDGTSYVIQVENDEQRDARLPKGRATWAGCMRASESIWDLICLSYHPGDELARKVAPTITYAGVIAQHLNVEVPGDDDSWHTPQNHSTLTP